MSGYGIALFFHMLGLGLATGVTAVVKLSLGRRNRARTVAEMLEWHSLLMRAAPFFPVSLATLLLSGGYMVGAMHLPWSAAFISAGLVGSVALLISGGVLAVTGRAFKRRLKSLAAEGAGQAPPKPEPSFAPTLSYANVGLFIGVVFDMSTKQVSLTVALAALVFGFSVGALVGNRSAPAAIH